MSLTVYVFLIWGFRYLSAQCVLNNDATCTPEKYCYHKKFLGDDGTEKEQMGCDNLLDEFNYKPHDMASQQCYENGTDVFCICEDRATFSCNRIFSMTYQAAEYASAQGGSCVFLLFFSLLCLFLLVKGLLNALNNWPKEREVPWYIYYSSLLTEMLITTLAFYTFLHFKLAVFLCYPEAINITDLVPVFYRMPEYSRAFSFALSTFFVTSSLSLIRVLVLLNRKNQLTRKDIFIWSVFAKLVCLISMSFSHRYLYLHTYHDVTREYQCNLREDLLDFSMLCSQMTLIMLCGSFFVELLHYISPSFERQKTECDNEVYSSTIDRPLLSREEPELEINVRKPGDSDIYSIILHNKSEKIVAGGFEWIKKSDQELEVNVTDPTFHLEPRQACFITVVGPVQSNLTIRFGFATDSATFQRHIILN